MSGLFDIVKKQIIAGSGEVILFCTDKEKQVYVGIESITTTKDFIVVNLDTKQNRMAKKDNLFVK